MANVTVKNLKNISAGNTNENRLVLEGNYSLDPNGNVEAIIDIKSSAGGLQFSNDANIDVNQRLWITGEKTIVTFNPENGLFVKQSANADSYSISI